MIDELEIRKTLDILKSGQLVEIRSVGKTVSSGYFRDFDTLIKAIKQAPNETYYLVLNQIKDDCYSREQNEKLLSRPKATTGDGDISRRGWLLIDADPKRASGVSATDGEKLKAKYATARVYNYLRDIGFNYPVVADSGNGYHLLYKISLENTKIATEAIKKFLHAIDMLFSDEHVAIDTSVFNASRITKLYGTIAQKGANTRERPHRKSRIIKIPEEILPTSKDLILKVANLIPEPERPTYRNDYNAGFDVHEFISRHGLMVHKEADFSNGTKFVLENCVFDPSHKAPDSAIFLMRNGAIGYKCFHNSCNGYSWRDVRLKFEPGAYDPKEQPRVTKPIHSALARQDIQASQAVQVNSFLRLKDIKRLDRSQIISVKSGIAALDTKIIGFNKGELSIWSGGNGSGKSTILSQLALDAIDIGFKVAMFSGELTNERTKNWVHLQAAGRQFTRPSQYGNVYYVPKDIGEKIDYWAGDKLWIYDNGYGMDASTIMPDLKRHIEQHETDVVIIDNLMSLDLTKIAGDKYEKQTVMVLLLADLAKKCNVHVHFVCHPRKPTGFLRKTDISGTADITNAADNVIMMHRVNRDFKNLAPTALGLVEAKRLFGYSNVMEVMKNRDLGIEDEFIGLYFEMQSKRMLNEPFENKNYGWNDSLIYTSERVFEDELPEEFRRCQCSENM